jgi:putative DNA primase/helicase
MRLPGFVHQKAEPFMVRIVQVDERLPYSAEQILAEFPPQKARKAPPPNGHDKSTPDGDHALNTAALTKLDTWVPKLFPAAHRMESGVWRVSSADLDRDLEEDLSIAPGGIVDFGVHDVGDPREGKRTPIDLVIEHGDEAARAAPRQWLADRLGIAHHGRPEIHVQGGNFAQNVRAAIEALHSAAVPIYDRGGQLVRPVQHVTDSPIRDGVRRADGALILTPVGADWLRVQLAEVAAWRKFDGRTEKWKPCDPPADVARTIVAAPDEGCWPYLRAIVRHPVLLPSGRRIERQGYDPETGLLIDAPGAWPPLPEKPTLADAQAAVEALQHLLRYFPWATDADLAVALSLMLTALASPILDAVPGHAVDAPAAGSGKSLLVDAAAILALGAKAAVLDYGADPDEAAKRLDSALLAGDPIVHLDNIETPLEGAALCQTITQSSRRMRLLGSNTMVTAPCNILITATGNNLTLRGDAVRRMLLCRLDAGCERPEERRIPQDLLAEVLADRGELMRLCQTIMAGYIHAGRPQLRLTPIGSFGDWSRLVRAPLVWAGTADPVKTIARARADDPGLQALAAVLTAWHEAWGAEPVTVASLIGLAEARAQNAAGELKEALALVCLTGGKLDGERLGKWLRKYRDCRAGGMRLARSEDLGHGGGAKWTVLRS